MEYEAQVLQVEDVAQEDAIVLEVFHVRERHSDFLLKYCEYGASSKVEIELNLEAEAELVGKVRHDVKVAVQAHVESGCIACRCMISHHSFPIQGVEVEQEAHVVHEKVLDES